jgi:peptidoglycan/xylan/chitin deacetylase (PgdA/CDA1 family)
MAYIIQHTRLFRRWLSRIKFSALYFWRIIINKELIKMDRTKRVINLAISICFWVIWQIWRWVRSAYGKQQLNTCIVLYYHSVSLEQRKKFALQMDDLIRFAKPIRADFTDFSGVGNHHAAVTFDDGFQSILANAIPELVQRKIPSTIFIPVGYLGTSAAWDQNSASLSIYEAVMTSDQIREISSDLVSFGSHSVTHPHLPQLTETEALRELTESRKKLESILGHEIRLFSFPYGEYNQNLIKMSHQNEYVRVFTILPTLTSLDRNDYVIGRVLVDPDDWCLEFRLKLLGAYCWLSYAITLKHKILHILDSSLDYLKFRSTP